MGQQWLNDVMEALKAAGWRVSAGYPGTVAGIPEAAVAAVNLSRVSTGDSNVGITVTVLVPRGQGLAACQALAAQGAVLLSGVGGDWSFAGWKYDSRLDCYRVDVEGTAVVSSQESSPVADGYEIRIGDAVQDHVLEFSARQDLQRRMVRPYGASAPSGVTPGMGGWSILLVQLVPGGEAEPEMTADGFTLEVCRGGRTVRYLECCWAEYETVQQDEGVRILRKGMALNREVM